jgi:pimeloyl-ACP methyl ester carboxylesterase
LLSPLHALWALPYFYLAYVTWGAFSFAHPRRLRYWALSQSDDAPAYEKILFKSRDGLTLFGWYAPGRNRAAIILVHGLGSSGSTMEVYARPLVRAGYSVFLMDLRGHGSSDRATTTYGVAEALDVAGAVDYLHTRGDIDPHKIGILGVSLGAQAALRGARQTDAIRALVLEGLGPADLQDRIAPMPEHRPPGFTLKNRFLYGIVLLEQTVFNFFAGQRPTPVTVEIGQLAPRPILLIPCGKREIANNRRFHAAAPEICTLWELPHARHAHALAFAPDEYPIRIVAFFDQAFGE